MMTKAKLIRSGGLQVKQVVKLTTFVTVGLGVFAFSNLGAAQVSHEWSHSGQPAQVVELFTSEGCSSCPPADRYLSTFKQDSDLWHKVIPIAYHVDYWDYLGWQDRFAQPQFSQLQRLYRAYGVVDSVYTPGFVVDGAEWRGFFRPWSRQLPAQISASHDTNLTLSVSGESIRLQLEPKHEGNQQTVPFVAYVVLLRSGLETQVHRGENRGKKLTHDFVALSRQQQQGHGKWTFRYPTTHLRADTVVAWVTEQGSYRPIQTVVGDLTNVELNE